MSPPSPSRWTTISLYGVVVLGWVLRLTGLGVHSLWFDEGATLLVAQSDAPLELLRTDHHMPLSFLTFRVWVRWFGESDVALRMLPALLSSGALVLFAWLAGLWVDARERLVAVALWAVSPFHVWHAQEVRMYPFLEVAMLTALGGIALFLRGRRAPGLVLVALGHAISLGSHYMGVLLFATPVAVAGIAYLRKALTLRRALELCLAAGAGLAAWTPWLVTSLDRQLHSEWGYTVKDSPRDLIEFPVRQLMYEPDVLPRELWAAGYLLGAILLAGFAWFLVQTVRRTTSERLYVVASFAAPVIAGLILLQLVRTGFQPKYVMSAAGGSALMIGAGLATLPGAWPRRAACAFALLGLLAITLLHRRANLHEDYRSACAETVASWQPGDWLASVSSTPDDFSQITVRHYLRDRPDIQSRLIDDATFRSKLQHGLQPGERLHVIYRDAYYAEAWVPQMESSWQLVQRDPMRIRLEHSLWTAKPRAP